MTPSQARAKAPSGEDTGEAWRALMRAWSAASDYPSLARISQQADVVLQQHTDIADRFTPLRLGIASSATADFIEPILKTALLALGINPTIHVAPYGQVTSSLLDGGGSLAAFEPQMTLVMHAPLHLAPFPPLTATLSEVERLVEDVCHQILAPCETFHERTRSEVVLTNFHGLPWRATGNLGARLPADATTFMRRLNLALSDRAPRFVHVFDVASLAERVGLESWFDERYWYLAKQPLAFDGIPRFARYLAAWIAGLLGRARKCLIVDLDNTLWGGVVGDEGVSGIQIGEGSAEGEAFKAFQCYLRELKERGVLLAVCSKNDEAVAQQPFLEHPDMVLRLDDFAAFKANWQPKSENIRALARELDLLPDAFVFVDDNPAEREEVAQALPDVAVPDLPDDPSLFVRALDAQRFFESPLLTEEDLRRTTTYQARQRAREGFTDVTDVGPYLASLEMVAAIEPFKATAFERVTQLVNKTNQFNLTTPRLALADVARMASEPARLTRTVRLRDRFADHGLISVLFGRIEARRLLIDAWLMSCRVLGRGVERAIFNELLRGAHRLDLEELVGFYAPTKRNGLVKDHYLGLGFRRDGNHGEWERWRLSVEDAKPFDTFIEVQSAKPPA